MTEIRDAFHQPFYRLLRVVGVSLLHIVYRWSVIGQAYVPKTGPVVLASNHIHNFDPIIVGASTPRFVHFMAKEELFRNRTIGNFLRYLGAFPIRRGVGDRGAIKHALAVTEDGQCLTVFPEGHRSKTGELGAGLPGVAMIARRAGCPVVPVAVIGPYRLRGRLTVRFGEPIPPDPDRSNEALLDELMTGIRRLLDEGHAP
ncbi:lysophospholipid acyltransferase family protein [Alicyclobacillus sp. ALC3]|uniref:lysophospholipid acyltransferase family protein n=1 Tax=Alicyclobacillus sp. ALC3 TaxID=2796143 RepID=UPI002379E035|nr:lysophospholipid acyltransferase family protein [Alicyclobacillus sp. ALC3]WDL97126.1 1-acyl-sn-glycerol-3-phosphate acyltransferase [Alicyclobacillus sp. ALC3]